VSETILAIIAACAIIAAVLMAALAHCMNERFTHFTCAYSQIIKAQNDLIDKLMNEKVETKHEQD
jgi:hypothetical protein